MSAGFRHRAEAADLPENTSNGRLALFFLAGFFPALSIFFFGLQPSRNIANRV
jgi:hypothetical protein